MGNNRKYRILATLSLAALLLTAGLSLYLAWEEPPAAATPAPSPSPTAAAAATAAPRPRTEPEDPGQPLTRSREPGVYTILLAGNDDGNGNTDTIMLGRIDTLERRMDFVSIPRDTYVELPWEVKKLNSVYWSARAAGQSGIEALEDQIEKLCGFRPDCYAVLDLGVLEQAVDTLGGVWFEVPIAMDYEDPSQDLSIHLSPGYQRLSGEQAMGLCRYRSSYVTGDIGRIEMQQQFLAACAGQMMELGKIPQLKKVAELLAGELDTDLSAGNLAWLVRQALRCKPEDLHFYTLPHWTDTIDGYSYALVDQRGWLKMLSEVFYPGAEPVTAESLRLSSYVPQTSSPAQAVPLAEEPAAPEPPAEPVSEGPKRVVVELGAPG